MPSHMLLEGKEPPQGTFLNKCMAFCAGAMLSLGQLAGSQAKPQPPHAAVLHIQLTQEIAGKAAAPMSGCFVFGSLRGAQAKPQQT